MKRLPSIPSIPSVVAMDLLRWSPADLSPLFWAGGFDPAGEGMLQSYPSDSLTTTAGQPVSLVMDMSKGRELSPELLTNTDFSGGAAGWTLGTGMAVVAGQLTMTESGSGQLARQTIASSDDRLFLIDWTLVSVSAGAIASVFGTTSAGSAGPSRTDPGRYLEYGIGAGTPNRFGVRTLGTTTGVVSSISCKEVLGHHAFQATALSRPTLRQSGAVWYLEDDGGDSLPAVFPAGSLYLAYVNELGEVSYTTATSDGTTGVDLLRAERMADVIVLDRAFTPDEEAKIEAYWARYAA